MEEQKIRALSNWEGGITPIREGDVYTLTNEGVMINGCLWTKFLEYSGNNLFEKWTDHWRYENMEFELVDDIKQNVTSIEFTSESDLFLELDVKNKNAITNFEYLDESQIDTAIKLLEKAREYLRREN